MELFASKDEKMERIEKRVASLERKMNYNFSRVGTSIELMKKAMVELQAENVELKKDRDFLLGKYKEALRRLPGSDSVSAVNERLVSPIKKEIKEASSLIRDIASEGFAEDFGGGKKAGIDSLFELVMNRKKLAADTAAKELGVDEKKVKYWALALEKKGLIKTNAYMGRTLLLKV